MTPEEISERSEGFITQSQTRSIGDAGLVETEFDGSRYAPKLFEYLDVQRPRGFDRMALKRQSDFLAGRVTAALALASVGAPASPIGIGGSRAPVWPTHISGSISHSHGRAASLVSMQPNHLCGVDIERIATGSALDAIRSKCLSERERQLCEDGLSLRADIAATLLFSAKETLYKALFPLVGKFFGFDAAESKARTTSNTLLFHLTQPLHPKLPAGFPLEVSCDINGTHVLTYLSTTQP